MSVVPQTPTPAYPGRRWAARTYPGLPSINARMRADLRSDLATLAGISPDLTDDVVLCASEAFANAVDHSRSGHPGGRVMRFLSTPVVTGHETILRLSVIDDGPEYAPRIPAPRTPHDCPLAERGRGLLLIHRLATEWGTARAVDAPNGSLLSTALWAEFAYPSTEAER
ncbi:ATP-binding protein [Nocardiopsis lucentensis]|uniref:ATP-binding protein n=1 Tax=Nocardiopsis lucentensis TaxID=53441 RepID=UPI0003457866|nr:ATP-binding protein [Nocardiopsis lucentensis]